MLYFCSILDVWAMSLSPLLRFYIYALHGCMTEVVYTGLWDLFYFNSFKTHGNTSIWALFIYGAYVLFIEAIHFRLKDLGIPLYLRGIVYTLWTFVWEFSTGYCLKMFNACPWDYGPWFDYNLYGLITLEYAPLWYMSGIFAEKVLIKYTLLLQLPANANKAK